MSKVLPTIELKETSPGRCRVFIEGEELHSVTSVGYYRDVDSIPECCITMNAGELTADARVLVEYMPSTVNEACAVLKDVYMKDVDFREAAIASIMSALNDSQATKKEMAQHIADRIFDHD